MSLRKNITSETSQKTQQTYTFIRKIHIVKDIYNNSPKLSNYKETPFGTFTSEASYSIEAAVVMSMMILVMAVFIWIMRAETTEFIVKNAMHETASEFAVWGEIEASEKVDENKLLKMALIARCKGKLLKRKKQMRFISGGAVGVDLSDSEVNDTYIRLDCRYKLIPITHLFDDSLFRIHENVQVRRYIGWNPEMEGADTYVYVTKHGTAYHRSEECTYLKLSIHEVDRRLIKAKRSKDGSKYKKCSCVKKGTTKVYITDYGNQYHGELNCTDLRRHIRRMHIEEAKKKYHSCPKCGGD